MYEKAYYRPKLASRTSATRPLSEATDMYETEFEEDLSDVDDYAGRRSEDSVSIGMAANPPASADIVQVWQAKCYNSINIR